MATVGSRNDPGLLRRLTGWTAPPMLAAIDAADDLTLTAGVSRSVVGQKLTAATASTSDG